MSEPTVLNVKIDKELKKQAQATAKELGVPMSLVVAGNLREFIRTRTITISDPPTLQQSVKKELLDLSKNAKTQKDTSPKFNNLDDAIGWLDA